MNIIPGANNDVEGCPRNGAVELPVENGDKCT